MDTSELKRIYGAFYGQIIGDALGCRYEGYCAETAKEQMRYEKRSNKRSNQLPILGSDPPFIKAGQITDDSEMALSLARSLVAKQKFDKVDVACAYAFWLCKTKPKTTGQTTRNSLQETMPESLAITSEWRHELTDQQKQKIYEQIAENVKKMNKASMSNGALMRISPLAIAFRTQDNQKLRELATEDAKLTHANPVVWDAVSCYVIALAGLLKGKSNEEAYNDALSSAETTLVRNILTDARSHAQPVRLPDNFEDARKYQDEDEPSTPENFNTKERLESSFKTTYSDGSFSGYIGIALQAVFYELLHADSFDQGLERAIERGGDTDTNGCIVAALLGAHFGVDDIPKEWIETVLDAEPCTLSYGNVRKSMNMDFLSLYDVEELVAKLTSMMT